MKKLFVILLGMTLIAGAGFAETISDADQKWLAATEKKVEAGQTEVSTPSAARVVLLKKWASDKGLTTQVQNTGQTFRVTLSRQVAVK